LKQSVVSGIGSPTASRVVACCAPNNEIATRRETPTVKCPAPHLKSSNRRLPRLRTVLFAVLVAILLLPLGGIGALRLYDTELIRRTEAELIGQGAFVAEAYRAFLRAQLESAQIAERNSGPDVKYRAFHETAETAASGQTTDGMGVSVRQGQPRVPILDRALSPILPRAAPARAHDVPPNALAVAAGSTFGRQLQAATKVTLSGVRVIGPNGYVVATSRAGLGDWIGHRPEVKRALRGESISLLRERATSNTQPPLQSLSRGNRVRVFVALPVVQDGKVWGAVVLSRTPLDVAKALYINRWHLAGGAVVLVFVVFAVGMITTRRISRPLGELVAIANEVASGRKTSDVALSSPGTREMAELAAALDAMASALQARADYLEAFAAHVSHAFKTPLTSIRGTVELLQDHLDAMRPAVRDRFLANLAADADRLQSLVQRLLVLARADTLTADHVTADAATIAQRCATSARQTGLAVEVHAEGTAIANIAPDALTAALDNLLENARQHAGVDAHVGIGVSGSSHGVRIDVRDDGPGIDAEVSDRLFQPFATTASSSGGHGLGLATTRALLRAHGGSIRVIPSDRGAHFVINLASTGPIDRTVTPPGPEISAQTT